MARINRSFLLFVALTLLLQGCGNRAKISQLEKELQAQQTELRPLFSNWSEYIEAAMLQNYEAFLKDASSQLHDIASPELAPELQVRVDSLNRQFLIAQLRVHALREDPSVYNLTTRWQKATIHSPSEFMALLSELKEAPHYYVAIRKVLTRPDPAHCQKAVDEHIDGLAFLNQLSPRIEAAQLTAGDKTALQLALSQAKIAIKDYIAWCNSLTIESFETK
ncbi:MAG: hypothetical protein ACKOAY_09570 [Haliscomenobacter sp.]